MMHGEQEKNKVFQDFLVQLFQIYWWEAWLQKVSGKWSRFYPNIVILFEIKYTLQLKANREASNTGCT